MIAYTAISAILTGAFSMQKRRHKKLVNLKFV